jgi:hypothetical protein
MRVALLWAVLLLALATQVIAQEPFEGETLISPLNTGNSYLIDLEGNNIETWHGSGPPAQIAYMLDDRSLLRPCQDAGGEFGAAGAGGRIQRIDGDDHLIWDYYFSTHDHQQHHDIEPMPNGNVLLIAWERKTRAEAITAGRQGITGEMWPTLIVEVEPDGYAGGNIVWEWHVWDHLIQDIDPSKDNYGVVIEHPELIDINKGGVQNGDWLHANAVHYNPELDQIVFSSNKLCEIYIIDHSTTSEEAAGHTGGNSGMGGDILYRWGNPQIYNRGFPGDQYYFGVHGVNWIPPGLPGEGNLLTLNNGNRPGGANDYSSAVEIIPPVDGYRYHIEPGEPFGPAAPVWFYQDPAWFYTDHVGGAYRLPNGNTLICEGAHGYIFEVTGAGEIVWDHTAPTHVHRAPRYWEETNGAPGSPALEAATRPSYPNPFGRRTTIRFDLPMSGWVELDVVDVSGRGVATLVRSDLNAGRHSVNWLGRDRDGRAVRPGIYFYHLRAPGLLQTHKLTRTR